MSGTDNKFTEKVLIEAYPHGAIGGYLTNYRDMAFKGRDEAIEFEQATTNLFADVFGYKSKHLGQLGAKSAPDIFIVSDRGYEKSISVWLRNRYGIIKAEGVNCPHKICYLTDDNECLIFDFDNGDYSEFTVYADKED